VLPSSLAQLVHIGIITRIYNQNPLQVAQLVAEHVLQGELPPIGVDASSELSVREAKEENIRLALL
jgi:Flp pilus assembly CpaF family ATPase